MHKSLFIFSLIWCLGIPAASQAQNAQPKIVWFQSGSLTLGGELYLPEGQGPFPVVLYNHGSAPKMKNSMAAVEIGPRFTENGWAFFMPYRRGQGLSEDQGPYIMDEINSARWTGFGKAAKKLVELLATDHLDDQIAALNWLRQQEFIDGERIATAGNSFGGIQVLLGMQKESYCAGLNAAGASQSWAGSEDLRALMKQAAANLNGPIFFFQAENDYDTTLSKELSAVAKKAGVTSLVKIYPAFGSNPDDGHSFPYRGVSIWFQDGLDFLTAHCSKPALNKANSADAKSRAAD